MERRGLPRQLGRAVLNRINNSGTTYCIMPSEGSMRVRYALLTLALGVLVSCQTTRPIWFIATPGYVDAKLATQEEAIRSDYESRISQLEAELDSQRQVAQELADLSGVIREVEASNRELQELAAQVERELAGLPEETIRLIVEALTRHLEEIP